MTALFGMLYLIIRLKCAAERRAVNSVTALCHFNLSAKMDVQCDDELDLFEFMDHHHDRFAHEHAHDFQNELGHRHFLLEG